MDAAYDPPQDPLDILHDDQHLLIVNKPAGLLSVPGKGPELADCLMSRILAAFPEALLVHRLDRDTSGVMVFALSRMAQRHLGLQFERRKARKTYLAQVWGEPAESEGRIELPLCVDWPNRPRQKVDFENGRMGITNWTALKRVDGTTRMRLVPETGRSHQLRVHMLEIGHPILGDPFYAPPEALAAAPRLMLHAESLRIAHPDGGKGLTFKAPAPF